MSKLVSELTVNQKPLSLEITDWLKANTTSAFSIYYLSDSQRCIIGLSSEADVVHFKLMFSDLLSDEHVRV